MEGQAGGELLLFSARERRFVVRTLRGVSQNVLHLIFLVEWCKYFSEITWVQRCSLFHGQIPELNSYRETGSGPLLVRV